MMMFSEKGKTTISTQVEGNHSISHLSEARIIIAYNSVPEFLIEVGILWSDIIPDIQSTAYQYGIDVEVSDYLISPDPHHKLDNKSVARILKCAEDSNTIVFCLVGDVYGDSDLPLFLKKEELQQITTALFEQSQDVKLLNDHYIVDRTAQPECYRLSSKSITEENREKLLRMIHLGAQEAFDEGVINQSNPERQRNLFNSPIHLLIQGLKRQTNYSRICCLLRRFESLQVPFADADENAVKKMIDLKNEISENLPCISFSLPEDGVTFFKSKDVEKYKDNCIKEITEKLKDLVLPFASKRPITMTYITLNDEEQQTHINYARQKNEGIWIHSKKMESRADKLLGQTSPGMYLIQGPTECGKTRLLCRLWDSVNKKNVEAIRVIRFVNLTYSCMYAHEIWHQICISICREAGIDPTPLLPHFHLSKLLNVFGELIEKITRPIYVFIDDIHSMKMGRLLCPTEKKSRKVLGNIIIIGTGLNVASIPQIFVTTSTINLETPSENDIIEILKKRLPETRKLTTEHCGTIKQQLSTEGRSFTLGQSLVDELILDNEKPVTNGLIGRLQRIEDKHGKGCISMIGKCLLHSRNGLTRCELYDLISSDESTLNSIGSVIAFPPLLFDEIIESFGSLLSSDVVDEKKVYRPSSITFLAVLRLRYNGDKLTICKGLIGFLYCDPKNNNDISISQGSLKYTPMTRSLRRDGTGADLRIIRQLWFYLLHTGDMDSLKECALCAFYYIDMTIRSCGIGHLLTMYEDTLLQVLHHDIQVLAEQVLLPAIDTIIRDVEQTAAEVIGRLRFTRAENSSFLNSMVEDAMGYVDGYGPNCLLVPLSCWVSPPKMSLVLSFDFKEWKNPRLVLVPTFNHQHILVTGNESAIGEIYMVHVASQFVLATFRGHTGAVTSICESSEGDFFTSTSVDKTVRVWFRNSDAPSKILRPHSAKIVCSVLSSDNTFLATGSSDSSAKIIDLESGNVLKTFPDHTGTVVSIQLTSNDLYLITGSGDFSVQMWNIKKGEIIGRMGGLMAPVTSVAITSNDAFVAVACEDETLRVFGTVSGQELHDMTGHEGKVNSLVAAHDDCQLFAATKSRIFCYDIHTGQIVLIWDTQVFSPVTSLQITRDNFFLISGCGGAVHVWNIRERIHDGVDQLMEAEGHVTAVALSHDDKLAACGTFAGIVALWDLDIAQCVCTSVHTKRVDITALAFSLDSTIVLSGNSTGNIILIETSHGRVLRSISLHNESIKQAIWMIGKRVVSVDKGGFMRVWEAFEEDEDADIQRIDGVIAPLKIVNVSGTNSVSFVSHTAVTPKELRVWNIDNNALNIQSRLHHTENITTFAMATHGSLILTGSADDSLKIWNHQGHLTQVLVGHEGKVTSCAIAADERTVVSGAVDKKVILWEVSTGNTLHTLNARAPISCVAITADGSVAFSADEEGWLETWSVDRGSLLSSFNSHRPIISLVCSSDASRLILKLPGCAQLPIVCLHNTPAGPVGFTSQRKRSTRNPSISSLNSNSNEKKDSTSSNPSDSVMKQVPTKPTAPRPTFDKLERSKSRLSITVEKEKSSVHGGMSISGSVPPVTRSKACSIL